MSRETITETTETTATPTTTETTEPVTLTAIPKEPKKKVVKRKPTRPVEELCTATVKTMSDKEKDIYINYLKQQCNYYETKIQSIDESFKKLIEDRRTKEANQFEVIQNYKQCINTLVQSISNANNVASMAINIIKTNKEKEN